MTTIEIRLERIKKSLGKIQTYDKLIAEDSLEPTTVIDFQGNVKNLCDEIKAEADQIKSEVNQWG